MRHPVAAWLLTGRDAAAEVLNVVVVQAQVLLELVAAHLLVANPSTMRLGEAAVASDPVSNFLQYGVLGLVVIGFATGWIVPGPQAKALAAENARLTGLIEEKIFPMLGQYAATMERAAVALERSAEAMDRQADRDARDSSRERR